MIKSYFLLIILIFLNLKNIKVVKSNELSQNELESIIFVITQYQTGWNVNGKSCSEITTSGLQCNIVDGAETIQTITISSTSSIDIGEPVYRDSLIFPNLISFELLVGPKKNTSYNILSLLDNQYNVNLKTLNFYDQTFIFSNSFPTYINLVSLFIQKAIVQSNFSLTKSLSTLTELRLYDIKYTPTYGMIVDFTNPINSPLQYWESSYSDLQSIDEFTIVGGVFKISDQYFPSLLTLSLDVRSSINPNFILNSNSIEYIFVFDGYSPISKTCYLDTLKVERTSVPNVPDASWFTNGPFTLSLDSTNSSGSMDFSYIEGVKTSISITGTQNVTLQLFDNYCQLNDFNLYDLVLSNTGYVPDCFYCYWPDVFQRLPSNTPPPPSNYKCINIQLIGKSLGYGDNVSPNTMLVDTPNYRFKVLTEYGRDTVSFSTKYNYSFNIFWGLSIKADYILMNRLSSGDLLVKSFGMFNIYAPLSVSIGNRSCELFFNSTKELNCIISNYSTTTPQLVKISDTLSQVGLYSVLDFTIISYTYSNVLIVNANFGFNPFNVSVTISEFKCNITSLNDTQLICTPAPNIPFSQYITIMVYANSLNGSIIYENQAECNPVSTCNGNGICINSICECKSGYGGYNCHNKLDPDIIILPNNTNPSPIIIVKDGLNFTFNIIAVQEIDELTSVIREIRTDKWIHSTIGNDTLSISTYNLQSSTPEVDQIKATIEYSKNSRLIKFAGQSTFYPENSLKLMIAINNWSFKNRLNQIRVLMETKAVVNRDKCLEPGINVNNASDINFLSISYGDQTLYGRFLPFGLSDNRPIFVQNQVVNKTESLITIGMILPYGNSIIIDPDFSVLINPNSKSKECSKGFETWKIVTIVVVLSVAAFAVAVATVVLLKKKSKNRKEAKRIENRLKEMK
ncbi:hypothetical protein PPL_08728 [Heterostelium album PN500]|uniref:EGF-like domain-containing protein n=1 Tax=Heterostelium pallidum (strain ATCC 26659 / Pp 5 / PN500) TaxID=670386 RepID=D3BJK0_HETP5|nr:hypothetical protein PPL_08728 [Heterostelium album PN500]EFA78080.1 hypothetical protein PPL_08728 [Heterostelium album PN500]|eukprot:XP_020430207.1 hypothetical protein PPL_08728 [Heterostelium album PN500]